MWQPHLNPLPEPNAPISRYDALWEAKCYSYDFAHEPPMANVSLTQRQLLGIAWARHVRLEVRHKGFSMIMTVDGRHRSGKSIFAVTLGCMIDRTFEPNMEARIVQTAEQLLDAIDVIKRQRIDGAVIIVDEAGASLSSMDWFERIMKAVVKAFTVIGYLHPIVIFIAPSKNMILSGLRQMSHVYVKVKRYTNEETTVTPYNIDYNTMRGKYFYRHPKVILFGQMITIGRIRFGMPPDRVRLRYEKIEEERKPIILREIREDGTRAQIKEARDVFDVDKAVEIVITNTKLFEAKRSKPDNVIINEVLIQSKFRQSQQICKMVKVLAEEKLRAKRGEENVSENKQSE